ncbi:hypothetical protein TNCV_1179701 [Trichonephila clavipes]|nr:hypothetical protein TNCV_1179701 [Trichonephila clavipes]
MTRAANVEFGDIQCLPHHWQRVVIVAGYYIEGLMTSLLTGLINCLLKLYFKARLELLVTVFAILNLDQVMRRTPELAHNQQTFPQYQREDFEPSLKYHGLVPQHGGSSVEPGFKKQRLSNNQLQFPSHDHGYN